MDGVIEDERSDHKLSNVQLSYISSFFYLFLRFFFLFCIDLFHGECDASCNKVNPFLDPQIGVNIHFEVEYHYILFVQIQLRFHKEKIIMEIGN